MLAGPQVHGHIKFETPQPSGMLRREQLSRESKGQERSLRWKYQFESPSCVSEALQWNEIIKGVSVDRKGKRAKD